MHATHVYAGFRRAPFLIRVLSFIRLFLSAIRIRVNFYSPFTIRHPYPRFIPTRIYAAFLAALPAMFGHNECKLTNRRKQLYSALAVHICELKPPEEIDKKFLRRQPRVLEFWSSNMTNADEERLNPAVPMPTEDAENLAFSTTKDSGYAWLVCGAAFCTLFVTLGIHYSCGVVFVALLNSFGESKAKTGKRLRG